jgi:peptide-methionine (R)-S-oxide reductase
MTDGDPAAVDRLTKTTSEWRRLLAPEAHAVLFEEATEQPFLHELNEEKRPVMFVSAACGLPLFTSLAKFKSGTGWPSFTIPHGPALGQ